MHTIKLLLTYYLNISVQAANLSDCRIESKKIDSVARIESKLFFARIGMLYYTAVRDNYCFECVNIYEHTCNRIITFIVKFETLSVTYF